MQAPFRPLRGVTESPSRQWIAWGDVVALVTAMNADHSRHDEEREPELLALVRSPPFDAESALGHELVEPASIILV